MQHGLETVHKPDEMRINDTKLSLDCDSSEGKNRNTTSSSILETTGFEIKTRDYTSPQKKVH